MRALAPLLVLLLAVGAGLAWWLLEGEGEGVALHDVERADVEPRDRRLADDPRSDPQSATPAGPGSAHLEGRPTAPPAVASAFSGRVVDTDGHPVPGAHLVVVEQERKVNGFTHVYERGERPGDTTDEAGDFRLDVDDAKGPVRVRVLVTAAGHIEQRAHVERNVPAEIVVGPGARLRVHCVDEEERDVPDARLHLTESSMPARGWSPFMPVAIQTATSDARGRAEFRLAPGTYALHVFRSDRAPLVSEPFATNHGETVDQTLRLLRGNEARFLVVDEENQPVAGAHLHVGALGSFATELVTDEDGRAAARGLPVAIPDDTGAVVGGRYRVFWAVRHAGFAPQDGDRGLPGTPSTLEILLRLVRGAPLTVRVVDPAGAPLAAVPVEITRAVPYGLSPIRMQAQLVRTTDADGRATFGPMTFPRTIAARLRGYAPHQENVPAAPQADHTIVLQPLGASVQGIALGPTGEPVPGLRVAWRTAEGLGSIEQRRPSFRDADPDGRFVITDLAGGDGELLLQAPGGLVQATPLPIEPGTTRTGVEARLVPGGPISGRVRTRGGEAVRVRVVLFQRLVHDGTVHTAAIAHTQTSEDGAFAFDGAPESEAYDLDVQHERWIAVRSTQLKVRGGDEDLDIVVKPREEGYGAALRLRVLANGAPYTGLLSISYVLDEQSWGVAEAEEQEAGVRRFTIGTPEGIYDFTLRAPGYLPTTVRGIRMAEVPDPPIAAEVVLDRGAEVVLRAVDEDGAPLPRDVALNLHGQVGDENLFDYVVTDDEGRISMGGLPAGAEVKIRASRKDEPMTTGTVTVTAPGEAVLELRPEGYLTVRFAAPEGRPVERAVVRLLDEGGALLDTKRYTIDPEEKNASARVYFRITKAGRYLVEAEVDGELRTDQVALMPGQRVTRDL